MLRTVGALLAQSRKPDEIIVLASDIDLEAARKRYTGATFYAEPNLNDWGHDKRAKGLDLATSAPQQRRQGSSLAGSVGT